MNAQPQLPFAPAQPTQCGDCVVWNGPARGGLGYCAYRGDRDFQEAACDQAFGKHELERPLYGRGRRMS